MANKGWRREPARHSLAARGKRTVQKKHANEPGPWKFQGYLPGVKDWDDLDMNWVHNVAIMKQPCPRCGKEATVYIQATNEWGKPQAERYWAFGVCVNEHEFAARPGYRSDGYRNVEYWAKPDEDSAPKKRKMSLKFFISANKASIDAVIRSAAPGARIDDDERELWVMNDEGLYLRARNAGVDI